MEREKLKEIIESLTELYEDEKQTIINVTHSLYSSQCTPCNNYGDTLFENIVITSEKK